MDFNLTDEQQMLREGAMRFVDDNYSFQKRREILRSDARCDERVWRSFADLGWLALTLPEDAGGLGTGLFEATILAEAIGRRLVLEPVGTTAVLCARVIEGAGHDGQRDELLAAIACGERRLALACLEPGRRYDYANPVTRARRSGDGYTLTGAKMLVEDAPTAHQFIVSACIDGGDGFGLFLVDAQATGLTKQSYYLVDGRRASDLDLTDIQLPASALLCDRTSAPDVLDEALNRYLVFQVAEALGAMESVMEQTAEHIRNRKQFGQPLAAFQALQHRVAEMFVEVQETRSALYHALAHFDAAPMERNTAVSSAKVVASEAGRVVGGQGIQLHGGVGMTDEYPVGHYYKRLLVIEKSCGDVDFHLDRIARTYR